MKSRLTRLVGARCVLSVPARRLTRRPDRPRHPPPQPPQPTFKVQVDYVEVDVVVTDQQGSLVRDLKKEDFQVLEDGKPQTISAFTLVDIPIERADRPLFAATPIEPDVKTNERPFDGRVYVMVIDDLHTRFGRIAAREDRGEAVHRAPPRRQRPDGGRAHRRAPATPTRNSPATSGCCWRPSTRRSGRKLDSATANRIERVQPHARHAAAGRSDQRSGRRGARVQRAQRRSTRSRTSPTGSASVRGRRKSILFVSEGIDYDIHDIIPQTGSNHHGASMVLDATRDAIAAATRSNVAIYGIDPRGLTDLGDEIDRDPVVPRRHVARHRPGLAAERAAPVAGQPAHAVGRNRRLRRRQPERLHDRRSSASSRTTARTTCWPTTRPTRRPGRVPQDRGARDAARLTVRARRGYVTPKKATPRRSPPKSTIRDAGSARGARQPAAGQRSDDARVRGAVQGHGAERVGAARRRDARPRSAARRRTTSAARRTSRSTRTARSAAATPTR